MTLKRKVPKESKSLKLVKYLLSSGSKGAIEGARAIGKISRSKERIISNEPNKISEIKNIAVIKEEPKKEIKVVRGKNGDGEPSFDDFDVEKKILGDYDNFKKRLHTDSKIILIFGKRGSGKSALGLRIVENIKAETNRNCYALGIDNKFLPSWISSITNIDEAAAESIILVDEGAVSFNSRESMRDINKELSKLMAIARHKDLTLLFITQNTGMIDRNILKLTDSLMIKEGSLLQQEMERTEIKKFYLKSKALLENVEDDKIKYFYLIDSDFEGLLKHSLPSFWTQELSKNKSS